MMVIGAFLVSSFEIAGAKSATGSDQSGDPGWPREKYANGTRLIIYQPQVDDWQNFRDLSWRMANWGSQMQDLDREAQNRWRGGQESQRFQDFQHGGGGFRGRR